MKNDYSLQELERKAGDWVEVSQFTALESDLQLLRSKVHGEILGARFLWTSGDLTHASGDTNLHLKIEHGIIHLLINRDSRDTCIHYYNTLYSYLLSL